MSQEQEIVIKDTVNPAINDDASNGHKVGTKWLNTNTQVLWISYDDSSGAAQWAQIAPTASPALSSANYIHAYDTTVQTIAVASTPQDVTFDTNHKINGWTHTLGTANFTCGQTGTYLINYAYFVQKTGGGPAISELKLFVNGVEEVGAHTSIDIITTNIITNVSNNALIEISSGQLLKFVFEGSTTFVELNEHTPGEPVINFTCIRIA